MSAKKDKAKQDYLKGMKYKDLAEKYGVSINTIKSWKQRYNWNRKSVHTNKKVCTQKQGAPKGNKNAKGNKGGSAPKKNKNSEKHGFFSKIMPEDSLELLDEIELKSPLDILWENIMIQYAAIARAQKLMFVKDQDDIKKHLKKKKDGDTFTEREWEFQYPWDRHANFLQAQARAITTLIQTIDRYQKMLPRSLEYEEQRLKVDKMKAEINKIKEPEDKDKMMKVVIVDDIPEGDDNAAG